MEKKFPLAILLTALCLAASNAAAENYICTLEDLVRRVEIYYEPGREVPCEVHYYKDTEMPGERQVPWRAQNEVGYCESRAGAFIEQLKSQGWDCKVNKVAPAPAPAEPAEPAATDEPAEPPAAAEPAGSDDTEALAPGEQ